MCSPDEETTEEMEAGRETPCMAVGCTAMAPPLETHCPEHASEYGDYQELPDPDPDPPHPLDPDAAIRPPRTEANLTTSEAWRLRGFQEKAQALRDRAAVLDQQAFDVAREACDAVGLKIDGPIEVVEKDEKVVVRIRKAKP